MGGTFDPIHHGHLVAASEVASRFHLDEVVFVPTGQPWQKSHQRVSPAEDRYLMTVIATASNPQFSVSRIDIDRGGKTYTIDTLRDLRARATRRRISSSSPAPTRSSQILSWRRRRRAVLARPLHRRHPPRARAVRPGLPERRGVAGGGPRAGDLLHRLPPAGGNGAIRSGTWFRTASCATSTSARCTGRRPRA